MRYLAFLYNICGDSPFETEFTGHNTSRSMVKSVMVELHWFTDQLMLDVIISIHGVKSNSFFPDDFSTHEKDSVSDLFL